MKQGFLLGLLLTGLVGVFRLLLLTYRVWRCRSLFRENGDTLYIVEFEPLVNATYINAVSWALTLRSWRCPRVRFRALAGGNPHWYECATEDLAHRLYCLALEWKRQHPNVSDVRGHLSFKDPR